MFSHYFDERSTNSNVYQLVEKGNGFLKIVTSFIFAIIDMFY